MSSLARGKRLHILVVDNDPGMADIIADTLGAAGHRTTKVFSGWEAVSAAREELFDMVICDIGMPKMDGYELAARLRALPSYRYVPLIAMACVSAYDDPERTEAALFNSHLFKPVTMVMLLDAVARSSRSPEAAILLPF